MNIYTNIYIIFIIYYIYIKSFEVHLILDKYLFKTTKLNISIQTFYNDFRENWWQRDADVTENYNSGKGAGGKR